MRGRVSICCPGDPQVLFRIWDIGDWDIWEEIPPQERMVRTELVQSHPERGCGINDCWSTELRER